MRRALLPVLLLACKSNNNAAPPAPSASVAATPTASAAPPAESPAHAEARRVVQAWSDALDKHDLVALEKTYGDPVVFYKLGPKPKKTVLAMKRSVLGPEVDVPPADHGPDRDRARIEGHVAGDVHEEIRQRHQAR